MNETHPVAISSNVEGDACDPDADLGGEPEGDPPGGGAVRREAVEELQEEAAALGVFALALGGDGGIRLVRVSTVSHGGESCLVVFLFE